jgi:hypothetical protein
MSADEASPNEEQLTKDAREFGSLVAKAAQDEIEGEASELRLQDIRNVFLRAMAPSQTFCSEFQLLGVEVSAAEEKGV